MNYDTHKNLVCYVDAISEMREDMLLMLTCSRKNTEDLLYRVVIEKPLKEAFANYDEKIKDIKPV